MSRRNRASGITRNQFLVLTGALIIGMGVFFYSAYKQDQLPEDTGNYTAVSNTLEQESCVSSISNDLIEESIEDQEVYGDPDNYVYPFNTMSADWGSELYDSGFKYYTIPQKYKDAGGCFPEVVQAYLWSLCKERGIDYYIVVALIERESGYKCDMTGDNGNSKGYMQIYEKWHYSRMEAEDVTDLYNPYQNIRVGLNFLSEIGGEYLNSSGYNVVLMVYNMGESTAKKYWDDGIYSTEYSRGIISRAQEIEQELQD